MYSIIILISMFFIVCQRERLPTAQLLLAFPLPPLLQTQAVDSELGFCVIMMPRTTQN